MWILVTGLLLFFAAHLIPTLPEVRTRLVNTAGSRAYSGLFALASLVAPFFCNRRDDFTLTVTQWLTLTVE